MTASGALTAERGLRRRPQPGRASWGGHSQTKSRMKSLGVRTLSDQRLGVRAHCQAGGLQEGGVPGARRVEAGRGRRLWERLPRMRHKSRV